MASAKVAQRYLKSRSRARNVSLAIRLPDNSQGVSSMLKRSAVSVALVLFYIGQIVGAEPEMRAHFIDVGQGASTLLEFPCGAILIDTGGQDDDSSVALGRYLTEFFRRRPDLSNTLS